MPSRLQTLQQEHANLIAEGKELLASAGDVLTEDEAKRDDEINARLDVLAGEINRENRLIEKELEGPAASDEYTRITGMHNRVEDDPMRGFASDDEFIQAVKNASMPGAVRWAPSSPSAVARWPGWAALSPCVPPPSCSTTR